MTLSNEFKVGATLLLTVILFFIGLRYLQNVPIFQSSMPHVAYLDDSGGLVPGNIVQLSGVKVGDINGVSLAEDGRRARIDFSIFERVPITEGAEVRISGIATFGGVRLTVIPGPTDAPRLAPGAEVPAQPSRDLLETFSNSAPQLLLRTDSLLAQATLTIAQANELMSTSQTDIQQTLASVRTSTDAIARAIRIEDGRVDRLVAQVEGTTARIDDFTAVQADSLAITIAQLNATLRHLDQFSNHLDHSAARVDVLLDALEQGEGSAGRLLTDPTIHDQLETTLINLNTLLEDLQDNPSRYLRDMSIIKLF